MNPKVEEYLDKATKWKAEFKKLRMIVLNCGLTEDFKWKNPCYTFKENNIVLIHGFKEYCAIAFFKGSLLKDEMKILIQQTENVQAGRQIRFTNIEDITAMETVLKAYIYEAIEVEKSGLKVEYKERSEFNIPEELQSKFNDSPSFQSAFDALTPGRQKAYLLYFSEPKQSKTRETRIEKYSQRILNGKGLNDCVCGLSKKMPSCDGSHKFL
jgi:uncharacterized protein YdeI (YjbR/CyaY-like superfamily)